MPDIVGNLKYAGTWGSAQLSGALHQLRSNNLVAVAPGIVDYPDTKLGWAISAAGNVNLPMLGEGDALWLAATYADGALGYLGFDPTVTGGETERVVADAFIVGDDIKTGRGSSVAGGLNHYWTPTIRQSVFGSYARVDYGANVAPAFDFTEWRAGSNVIWSPVSGLDIGVEVLYSNLDPRGPASASTTIPSRAACAFSATSDRLSIGTENPGGDTGVFLCAVPWPDWLPSHETHSHVNRGSRCRDYPGMRWPLRCWHRARRMLGTAGVLLAVPIRPGLRNQRYSGDSIRADTGQGISREACTSVARRQTGAFGGVSSEETTSCEGDSSVRA